MKNQDFNQKAKQASLTLQQILNQASGSQISLTPKPTTHIIPRREKRLKLNLRHFNQVISVNPKTKIAEVEGATNFYELTKATLKHNLVPKVVPELRAITIGGTVSGLGVESSSFKFGMVHNTLKSCTVLLSSGKILDCSPRKNSDLFRTLPNSFGTLGYVLKCQAQLISAKKFVKLSVTSFKSATNFFKALKQQTQNQKNDYLDGFALSNHQFFLIQGQFTDNPAELINLKDIVYYKHIEKLGTGTFTLSTFDYLWRWDPDAFWGTDQGKVLTPLLHHIPLRKTLLKPLIRSDRLLKMRIRRNHLQKIFSRLTHTPPQEILIQDVGVEIDKCTKYFAWFHQNLNLYPVWFCPITKPKPKIHYPLFNWPGKTLVDIGFYGNKPLAPGMKPDHYNKISEQKLFDFKGMKGLYSHNSYSQEEFWKIYDQNTYQKIKKKYDPKSIFPDLYTKVVTNFSKS